MKKRSRLPLADVFAELLLVTQAAATVALSGLTVVGASSGYLVSLHSDTRKRVCDYILRSSSVLGLYNLRAQEDEYTSDP